MKNTTTRCDIFCNVIDNYGDIGVCWRLSRQLAQEYGLEVRLWVDDLSSFAMLCPEADAALGKQQCHGVEICLWQKSFPEVQPADIVIEAFSCALPGSYIAAMAEQVHQPVWINLEYLSGEDWVESHHKLPSPHPKLPLTKYYFFPGFTRKTGGLLLERDLLARRDTFQNDTGKQQVFWKSIGMEMPPTGTLRISLFAYENAALSGLFDAWAASVQAILCLVPEGRILPEVGQYFGDASPCAGKVYKRGNLQVRVLPFVEQERYDELLWACDVNFVRGEDSFVRAQWAGKPFIWQIYPQHDAVHLKKLEAFLMSYGEQLGQSENETMQGMWMAWNSGCDRANGSLHGSGDPSRIESSVVRGGQEGGPGQWWPPFMAARGELERHAQLWARQLSENNLALNLLDFCQQIGRMRALKIEGQ